MAMYLMLQLLFSSTIFLVSAQTANYEQDVVPGQTYHLYTPQYPNKYYSNINYQWLIRAPTSYQMNLTCDIELPNSQACTGDRLLISLTGNTNVFIPTVVRGHFLFNRKATRCW
ncbi:hypothetical protein L9F63_005113 [Diploptera punctata]|uniref:CUB domain-containing protein n=1 Tax=Diploptera punctata TaxID=6984 RepID=A0AAD8E621_DIPPU|nr:hypothetical protein L9F63_005113 [Diploptera punctata]